jgi:hypothetical protein
MSTPPATTQPQATKHSISSVLFWVRIKQFRQTGMDYWKGPHSGIIAATPGPSLQAGKSTASRKSPSNPRFRSLRGQADRLG